MTAIALPAGLQTIGKGAFAYCPSLTDITYPDTIRITDLPRGAPQGRSRIVPG
ncbi:MAG: leucine-rich repeat domain-containing protein [Spirochaetaceae bacterium]|nr:leucine-rich repeat domain-containing protein [Spirochaetaceae bacterium]